jgi:hypothetical protein
MIETELWLSFVSMLRSYAAAASLHAGEVNVFVAENAVTIAAGDARLEMQFDPASSIVSWTRRTGSLSSGSGSFTIELEGTVSIDGVSRDLDHAAIDFIASVTENAKGGA